MMFAWSLFVIGFLQIAIAIENPENFVNMLAGTFTDGRSFSTGNTLPLIARPWGFNHWAPQTARQDGRSSSWWFDGNQHFFTWMRCTHQPSPWIGDWGWFLFTPIVGGFSESPVMFWEPRGAVVKPYLFDATLAPNNVRIELVPTDHGSIFRVSFPVEDDDKRICFNQANWDHTSSSTIIKGVAQQVNSDRTPVQNFHLFIYAESKEATGVESKNSLMCFKYPRSASIVEVRMATSLISHEQAKLSKDRELPYQNSFEVIAKETKSLWNKLLRRIDVIQTGDDADTAEASKNLGVFYTGLTRALLFPRKLDEINEKGEIVHYSPYDPHGGIHAGSLVTDNGFWDTFRTVYPLLSIAYKEELGLLISGWLNAYKEGKWLPSWASPGYRNCMVGTFADVVIADAIVKKIPGFDYTVAKDAIYKDSFENPPSHAGSAYGKEGLSTYINQGFFPYTRGGEGVSRSLDFGFSDWSVANAFQALLSDSSYMESQSHNRNLKSDLENAVKTLHERATRAVTRSFSKSHGLMVPIKGDGGVSNDFDAFTWGNGFMEGNSWHHSFPPYALDTLVSLHGGKAPLLKKLTQLVTTKSDFKVGSYGSEIHEMVEARAVAMGQYGHNNQPSHHLLYLFAMLGDSHTTEVYIRKVINSAYGIDFYAGDEDNGEQGAWYVLSALGLYSVTPGSPDYVLNTPLFKHVAIYTNEYDVTTDPEIFDFSKAINIVANTAGPKNIHTNKRYLDKQEMMDHSVSLHSLHKGSILQHILEHEEVTSESDLVTLEDLKLSVKTPLDLLAELETKDLMIKKLNEEISTHKDMMAKMHVNAVDAEAANHPQVAGAPLPNAHNGPSDEGERLALVWPKDVDTPIKPCPSDAVEVQSGKKASAQDMGLLSGMYESLYPEESHPHSMSAVEEEGLLFHFLLITLSGTIAFILFYKYYYVALMACRSGVLSETGGKKKKSDIRSKDDNEDALTV